MMVVGIIVTYLLVSVVEGLPDYCGSKPGIYAPFKKSSDGEELILKQVHVVTRHGDRVQASAPQCWHNEVKWDCTLTSASLPIIKHDQHELVVDRLYRKVNLEGRESVPGDCLIGSLTFEGYQQLLANGKSLRKAYIESGFLPSNYSYTRTFLRSDDMSRTLQSAQALIWGMYPPPPPVDGRSQVIDIHTMDKQVDNIEPNPVVCPRLGQYNKEFHESQQWIQHYNSITKPLLLALQKALHMTTTPDLDNLDHIIDCVYVHKCHRAPIPPGITDDLFKQMVDEILWQWYSQFNYPSAVMYSKVGMGFLIKEMWEAMQLAMAGEGKKFYLYSGHDFTLMALMTALNISTNAWPPYASMLQLELYQTAGAGASYAVRAIFNGNETKFPFCGMKSLCDLATFAKYVESVIPLDPVDECAVTGIPVGSYIPPGFKRLMRH